MRNTTMYREPDAFVSDIEVMTGKSFRTAQRIMARIKKHYGIPSRKRPTIEQVKAYLVQV